MKSEQALSLDTNCTIRLVNKQIRLSYGGRTHFLKLHKGMKQLLVLLTHPGMAISINQLDACHAEPSGQYSQFRNPDELKSQDLHPQDSFAPVEMADYAAINASKQALLQITAELAELIDNCDCARAEELMGERDALQSYLREVYRPHGKIRKFPDEGSLLRLRVRKSLQRALAEIEQCEPLLAKELRTSLDLHAPMIYRPRALEIDIYGFNLV